jgi:hypothetical protein
MSVSRLSCSVSVDPTVYATHLPSGDRWGSLTDRTFARSSSVTARLAGWPTTACAAHVIPIAARQQKRSGLSVCMVGLLFSRLLNNAASSLDSSFDKLRTNG